MSPLYSCYITDRSLPPPDDHRYGNNHTLPFKTLMTDYWEREKEREQETDRAPLQKKYHGITIAFGMWYYGNTLFLDTTLIVIP